MYWIIFTVLISAGDDTPTFSVQVPEFAKSQQFDNRAECLDFLTQGFINGKFPDIGKPWNLVAESSNVQASSHSIIAHDAFINYSLGCVRNEV